MVVAVAPSVAACLTQLGEHSSNYREGSGVLLISAPEKTTKLSSKF